MKSASLTQDRLLNQILMVLGASWLIALGSWISVPLPFTPVPVAFGDFAAVLVAVVMGRRGVAATLAYIAQGAAGLPFFSLGRGGLAHMLGPTGGYIIGYAIVAFAVALLLSRFEKRTPVAMVSILSFAFALVFAFGVPHLALFVGMKQAILLGCVPFIGANALKVYLAYFLLKRLELIDRPV